MQEKWFSIFWTNRLRILLYIWMCLLTILDEPDIIRRLGQKGEQVRIFQDNSVSRKKDKVTGRQIITGHGADESKETRAVTELREKRC